MKKIMIIVLFVSTGFFVQAQESFFSVSGAYRAEFENLPWIVELHSASVHDFLMFRGGVELPLLFLTGDVSLIYDIADSGVRVYVGVGADLAAFVVAVVGLHALTGLEFKVDNLGLFAEYQIGGYVSGMPAPEGQEERDLSFTKIKFGLNIYTP